MRGLRGVGAGTVRILLAVTVLVLLAGLLVWQSLDLVSEQRRGDDRGVVTSLAEDQVLDLTTLDTETVDDKLVALERRTTGDFKTQLSSMTQTFQAVVREQTISAEGTIVASALAEQSEGEATIMVVVSTRVSSDAEDEATERSYRISVSTSRRDGEWLISNMEFVA